MNVANSPAVQAAAAAVSGQQTPADAAVQIQVLKKALDAQAAAAAALIAALPPVPPPPSPLNMLGTRLDVHA